MKFVFMYFRADSILPAAESEKQWGEWFVWSDGQLPAHVHCGPLRTEAASRGLGVVFVQSAGKTERWRSGAAGLQAAAHLKHHQGTLLTYIKLIYSNLIFWSRDCSRSLPPLNIKSPKWASSWHKLPRYLLLDWARVFWILDRITTHFPDQ